MKKHELLIPAGDMNCLRQAVFHGADAVYLACKNFGARKFATNFSNEEIVEAIRFCHLYGVKLYVTMNTLIRDNEVDSFLEQARFLHENHVDALIVQDFGMICLLREKFPNLEIHASTQANNSSQETCQLFYDLGVKRVVFSRELSIDEIDSIDVPIEKEAFVHGALCVSYSGCCLMSSMLGGRSGNRGECAGSCRLPYSLEKDGKIIEKDKYLLSMKELNTSSEIHRLLNSSVYSFKIEGRMKGPLYVAFITEFYRKLIDGVNFSYEEELDKLKTIFNREFTLGHIFGVTGIDLINHKSPNHIGLRIGKAVVKGNKIQLELDSGRVLHQHDSIRFLHSNMGMVVNYLYDKKDNLCNSSNSICFVDNKVGLEKDDILMKTQDGLLEEEYLVSEIVHRISVQFSITAKVNQKLSATISDGVHSITRTGDVVEASRNAPIMMDDIKEKFSKLGNTPFMAESIMIDMDDKIFIPIKWMNDLRRDLVSALIDLRENPKSNFKECEVTFSSIKKEEEHGITCFVFTEEQLKKCLDLSILRIYVSNEELYKKYQEYSNVYLFLGRCRKTYQSNISRKAYSDTMYFDKDSYGLYFLNVTNIYSAYYLQKYGLQNIPLSVELTESEISEIIDSYHKKFGNATFEVFTYGLVENMIINDNIMNLEQNYTYQLVDFKERKFPVFFDGEMTHIYNYQLFDYCYDLPSCVYFLNFYEETPDEVEKIIKSKKSV